MYPDVHTEMNQDLYRLILEQRADLYVLTNNDIEWEKDDVRFYPENKDRQWFMDAFEKRLKKMNAPYVKLTSTSIEDRKAEVEDEIKKVFQ